MLKLRYVTVRKFKCLLFSTSKLCRFMEKVCMKRNTFVCSGGKEREIREKKEREKPGKRSTKKEKIQGKIL